MNERYCRANMETARTLHATELYCFTLCRIGDLCNCSRNQEGSNLGLLIGEDGSTVARTHVPCHVTMVVRSNGRAPRKVKFLLFKSAASILMCFERKDFALLILHLGINHNFVSSVLGSANKAVSSIIVYK